MREKHKMPFLEFCLVRFSQLQLTAQVAKVKQKELKLINSVFWVNINIYLAYNSQWNWQTRGWREGL